MKADVGTTCDEEDNYGARSGVRADLSSGRLGRTAGGSPRLCWWHLVLWGIFAHVWKELVPLYLPAAEPTLSSQSQEFTGNQAVHLRISESLRLEKTSKITKSNHQPIPTTSLGATSPRSFNTSVDGDSTTSLGSSMFEPMANSVSPPPGTTSSPWGCCREQSRAQHPQLCLGRDVLSAIFW